MADIIFTIFLMILNTLICTSFYIVGRMTRVDH